MFTRWRQPTRAFSEEEDEEGVIPQTSLGEAAPEMEHKGARPADQRQEHDLACRPHWDETDRKQPTSTAAILTGERDGVPAITNFPPKLQSEVLALRKRLRFVK
ncbi:unnamed protein product [Lampetra fluviatilis]